MSSAGLAVAMEVVGPLAGETAVGAAPREALVVVGS